MSEEVTQSPDWVTYVARGFFLLMALIALIRCVTGEGSVPDFNTRFNIGAFWFFCVLAGATIWVCFKRLQMKKTLADVLMIMVGVILQNGGQIVGRLAQLAK